MITVLGAGPAGATASLLLARWGHDVRIVTKSGSDHRLAVSLPPSCAKLFQAIGVSDAIEGANFVRSTGNTVWWGGAEARTEPFAEGERGWQVNVSRLSEIMLTEAIRAGAKIEHRVVEAPPAGFVLDCTGRSGVIARANTVRRYDAGPRTVALIGEWRRVVPWSVPDDTHTLIESYDDGWMWSVPLGDGVRHIAAMIDPQRSDLARNGSAKHVYLGEIAKTVVFRSLAAEASLEGGPWGWDASPYHAAEYAGDDWLLVGDAGSFVDPLSSAGVKKALASGWLAAIVANTCVASPHMKTHALSFFNRREREIADHLSAESRRILSDAAAGHHRAFWEERSEEPELEGSRQQIEKAFARLKAADRLVARVGPEVSIEPRPSIRGHEIVLDPHVIGPVDPNGVRYVQGVNVVALVGMASRFQSVPDLFEAFETEVGPVPLHDFLMALATALAREWLV